MESRHYNHPPCDVLVMLDFKAFFDQFELIAEQHFLFLSVDFIRKGYRRSVCGADSIYFRIENNTVEIMSIIGRQDLDDNSLQ